jgi:hypothetical protein
MTATGMFQPLGVPRFSSAASTVCLGSGRFLVRLLLCVGLFRSASCGAGRRLGRGL